MIPFIIGFGIVFGLILLGAVVFVVALVALDRVGTAVRACALHLHRLVRPAIRPAR